MVANEKKKQISMTFDWVFWLKIAGLVLLLTAWGADQFWRSASIDNLKKIEFMTINGSIIDNSADLQFLKYINQNRSDPRLLALSYRNLLQATATTSSLLLEEKVKGADAIVKSAFALLSEVQRAYDRGQSLEPKDIGGRAIKSEIVHLNGDLQKITQHWLNEMRKLHRISGIFFVIMYTIGSMALIASEIIPHLFK